MLFDPRPKTSRKELFDRKKELEILDRLAERGEPLILVLGIRRIGKTSLLKSFLERWNGIYIDMRGVSKTSDLYERLSRGLSVNIGKLRRFLEGIRGIKVMGLEIELKWRGRDSISLLGLLEELNKFGERFIVIFDEAQLIKPPVSIEIKNAIAYTYDHLENITIILSGSEIGLLRDFIGIENPDSPLYGRYSYELVVERFPNNLAMEFMRQGFREAELEVDERVIEEAVELFDGIVGWLVFYGRSYIDGVRDPSRIFELAVNIALREIERLSIREKMVLKAIGEGAKSWSEVRRYIMEEKGYVLPKSTLSRIIRKLEKMSIVKNYEFLDPVYRFASRRIRIG